MISGWKIGKKQDKAMTLEGGNNIIAVIRRVFDVLKLRLTQEM